MLDRLLMPLRFDATALLADAQALDGSAWEKHFNAGTYQGDWSGVALRSNGGRAALYPNAHTDEAFADTPLLAHCPNVRQALQAFSCEMTSVRFLRLGPGARILEHRDYGLTLEGGEARMHICVQSNERVEFLLDARPVVMAEGECWYLDVNKPHSVANLGTQPRIHLVIDCMVNAWLRERMALSAAEARV
jgi:mannose-6-phosphate isomerase-like protein (cupin superfamily)